MQKKEILIPYNIPICSTYFNQLSKRDITDLEYTGFGQSLLIQNIFFNREFKMGYIIFNFKSKDYPELFWDMNKDFFLPA